MISAFFQTLTQSPLMAVTFIVGVLAAVALFLALSTHFVLGWGLPHRPAAPAAGGPPPAAPRQYGAARLWGIIFMICALIFLGNYLYNWVESSKTPSQRWIEQAASSGREVRTSSPKGFLLEGKEIKKIKTLYEEMLQKANAVAKEGGPQREVEEITALWFSMNQESTVYDFVQVFYNGKNVEGKAIKGADLGINLDNWDEDVSNAFSEKLLTEFSGDKRRPSTAKTAKAKVSDPKKYAFPVPEIDTVNEPDPE